MNEKTKEQIRIAIAAMSHVFDALEPLIMTPKALPMHEKDDVNRMQMDISRYKSRLESWLERSGSKE